MAKKKTAKSKKPGMKKIFEVTEKEVDERKKTDMEELRRKIIDWSEKQAPVPNHIRKRPCGGCDVVLGSRPKYPLY